MEVGPRGKPVGEAFLWPVRKVGAGGVEDRFGVAEDPASYHSIRQITDSPTGVESVRQWFRLILDLFVY